MNKIRIGRIEKENSKEIHYVFLNDLDTNFVARECFKDGTIKRYPFSIKQGQIVSKYKCIKCITTRGVKPSRNFSVSLSKGYGFYSKVMNGVFAFFEKKMPHINEIILVEEKPKNNIKTVIEGRQLIITIPDFHKLGREARRFEKRKDVEIEKMYQNTFASILPSVISPPKKTIYTPGTLSSYLENYSKLNLSKEDKEKVKDIFINSDISLETIVSAKTELDIIYFEDIIKQFEQLIKLKNTKNLEEKWHQFFKNHTWILSKIFSFPAVFLEDKMNVGGHNILGGTDKIVDFLVKNSTTNNIAFIEIKTHQSKLVGATPYRKPDIFSIHSELSGGIIQVLDQKNKLLKNFHSKIGNSSNSLNSVCVVIAGNTEDFKKPGQKESFELFRWSNKDVIIVPFNELLEKIKFTLSIFKKNDPE